MVRKAGKRIVAGLKPMEVAMSITVHAKKGREVTKYEYLGFMVEKGLYWYVYDWDYEGEGETMGMFDSEWQAERFIERIHGAPNP